MNKRLFFLFIVVAVLTVLVTMRFTSHNNNDIKIGMLLPQTGGAAFLGNMCKNAVDIAVEEINENGGVNGRKVTIIYGDNKNDAKEGIALFNKMKLDGIDIIITSMSGPTVPLKPLLADGKTLLFATNVSTYKITEGTDWMFRLFVNAGADAGRMAMFVMNETDFKRIAVVAVNDEMGRSFASVFTMRLKEKEDVKIVAEDFFPVEERNFREISSKMKELEPDAIYLVGYDSNLGLLTSQLRTSGIKSTFLSIGTIAQENVRKSAGSSIVGAYYTYVRYNPEAAKPASKAAKFVDKYKNRFGSIPTYFSAFSYDTIYLIWESMRKVGTTPAAIKEALLTVNNYEGVIGPISFAGKQDASFEMEIRKIGE